MSETLYCYCCGKPADGAMLGMGQYIAHAFCVIRKLNELLDSSFDGTGEPVRIVTIRKGEKDVGG